MEPAHPATPVQTTFYFDAHEEAEFEIQASVKQRGALGSTEFLTQWKGYPDSEKMWELQDTHDTH